MKKEKLILLMIFMFIPSMISAGLACLWGSPEGCMYLIYEGNQYVNCGDGYYYGGSGSVGDCPGVFVEIY